MSYHKQVKQIPQLTKEEELELFIRFSKGDIHAKNKLIEHNLKLVIAIASYYKNESLPFSDLVQEGNIGLIQAVEGFDITKGYCFSTYASYYIRKTIMNALKKTSNGIRIPDHIKKQWKQLKNSYHLLYQQLYRNPTLEEIAHHLNLPLQKVQMIYQYYLYNQNPIYLQEMIEEDYDTIFLDETNNSENLVLLAFMKQDVHALLEENSLLTDQERFVLKYRLGFYSKNEMVLFKEIAMQLHLSTTRIQKIYAQALHKLRVSKQIIPYSSYLEDELQAQNFIKKYRNDFIHEKK